MLICAAYRNLLEGAGHPIQIRSKEKLELAVNELDGGQLNSHYSPVCWQCASSETWSLLSVNIFQPVHGRVT